MKVVRLLSPGGLEHLEVMEETSPEPGPGELLVRVRAASLNYHDYLIATGKLKAADRRIPLSDGAGDVIAVGAGVQQFKVGDAVISSFFPGWPDGEATPAAIRMIPGDTADGYARDLVAMPSTAFTHAPAGYTHIQSATLPCAALTAWRALVVRGQVTPGETVLVLGTGGVSLFALQFAKAAGAHVIATSSSEHKLERLRRLGADEVINSTAETEWGRRAKQLTGGGGVDHVIEVGGPGTLEQSMRACRIGGHIAMIGVMTGTRGTVSTALLFTSQLRISGISVGSQANQRDMIQAIERHSIQPIIDRVFPLTDIGAAFRYQGSQAHMGKICVEL